MSHETGQLKGDSRTFGPRRRVVGWRRILVTTLLLSAGMFPVRSDVFDLPPLPKPWQFGNVSMNRNSTENGQPPVIFSHALHRTRHTCRVCHFELEFEMAPNTTEVTEEANRNGRFCGACHDGRIAFGHTEEHCSKCHRKRDDSRARFKQLSSLATSPVGDKIDWVSALEQGQIHPKQSLFEDDFKPISFKEELKIEAGWVMISPAEFSHDVHTRWLDCANCHPDIFNVKRKTTAHFEMRYILDGLFCGACHLKVAFPIHDCTRCHESMRRSNTG